MGLLECVFPIQDQRINADYFSVATGLRIEAVTPIDGVIARVVLKRICDKRDTATE
jgi:hypothetical protein